MRPLRRPRSSISRGVLTLRAEKGANTTILELLPEVGILKLPHLQRGSWLGGRKLVHPTATSRNQLQK
eukprot:4982035-Prorocentrum_lima.AAC.1